jgi:hypothetical protein
MNEANRFFEISNKLVASQIQLQVSKSLQSRAPAETARVPVGSQGSRTDQPDPAASERVATAQGFHADHSHIESGRAPIDG